jgi:hypothetical protein
MSGKLGSSGPDILPPASFPSQGSDAALSLPPVQETRRHEHAAQSIRATARYVQRVLELPGLDSNLDKENQNHLGRVLGSHNFIKHFSASSCVVKMLRALLQ